MGIVKGKRGNKVKGEIMISDLSINLDRDTGKKYLYGGLIDFYADSEEGLERLTGTMIDEDLFCFGNTGRYVGVVDANMHWTFDDGGRSMDWLMMVAIVLQRMNKSGDDIKIKINKKFLLENDAVCDLTVEGMGKVRHRKEIIDLYVYYLKRVMEDKDCAELLRTQIRGKLCGSIPSVLENGMIYVEV